MKSLREFTNAFGIFVMQIELEKMRRAERAFKSRADER